MNSPQIVSRSGWGAATRVAGNRHVAPGARRRFVVHWPVMGTRDERQWVRDIERVHVGAITRDAAPAYNFLAGQSGTLFEGCGRDVRGPANGTNAANIDGWSCCVLQPSTAAGVPQAAVTQAARNSVRALYEWLCGVAGRRLTMNGHRQIVPTICPGSDLFAWVQQGMPATGGAPGAPTPDQRPEEDELLASGVADNGTLHVFRVGPARQTIWLTHQAANSTAWWGGQAGRAPAGFRRFADAPTGRTFRGITCERSAAGTLCLWAELDNGQTMDTWQRRGESTWQPLRLFAR